ncbi:hypothetical protein VTI74DRAFT_619 [Chaetomium olivicolor]
MAPTNEVIAKELASVVRQTYNGPERDQLTVNYARQTAEKKLKLGDGFLKDGAWKAKSKEIILATMAELERPEQCLRKEETSAKTAPAPSKRAKSAPKPSAATKKRAKKAPTPSDADSEVGNTSDEDVSERPVKKHRIANGASGRKTVIPHDLEEESVEAPSKPAQKRRTKRPTESESELSDVPDETQSSKGPSETPRPATDEDESSLSSVINEPPKPKPKPKPSPPQEPTNDAAEDSSSSLSSVLDEAPPPKRKRGSSKTTTKSSASGKDAPSPDEALIKTLQSQLAKCGVRKVWAFEFKKCGADTPKAKIRRLKEMLAEVGMTGRFSEAKAREIKEMRELQADLQDVMQGEKNWGVGSEGRGRARRAAATKAVTTGRLKEEGSDEETEGNGSEEEDGESDEGGKLAVRGRGQPKGRPRAALAFLGDESESESD